MRRQLDARKGVLGQLVIPTGSAPRLNFSLPECFLKELEYWWKGFAISNFLNFNMTCSILARVCQDRYLPSLSINYLQQKFLKKFPPQLEKIKMKICYDQGATTSLLSQQRNDAIAYFTCACISRQWKLFFQNRSRELFPPIAASMFLKFKRKL